MKIRSISHGGVTVSDFEKTVSWYHDMFGFNLITEQVLEGEQVNNLYTLYKVRDAKIRIGFLRAPKGGVIEIFEFSPSAPKDDIPWNKPGYTHIALDIKSIDKWYKTLSSKGVYFFSEPQNTGNVEWVFLKDIDGNLIELIDLKSNYPVIRLLGGIAGRIMAKSKFKEYYLK